MGEIDNGALPYIDEERESRSMLRKSLDAEPMEGDEGEGDDDNEIDDDIEPVVEIIEPRQPKNKRTK